jgi:hypothetical protein
MSRLERPLVSRRLWTTGDEVVRAELDLELKTGRGTWVTVRFRVDPGTEMTTMLAADARDRNLPMPRGPVLGLNLLGQEVRSGLLRARIVGMDATEYVFPCYFLGDPNAPVAKSRNLLGLTGVINQIRFTFDGRLRSLRPTGSSWSRSDNGSNRREASCPASPGEPFEPGPSSL